jgi:hypothetical protein
VKKIILVFLLLILAIAKVYCQWEFYDPDAVQEIRISIQAKSWKYTMDSVFEATNGTERILCDVTVNGQSIRNAGIRYKGFSSVHLEDIKNPFNIDLAYSKKNRNYRGFTSLRLSNVNYDPSFIREIYSYEIARKYMPAPHSNFANVYINDTLIGLYSNVEAVNSKFITHYFPTNNNSFLKGSPLVLEYPFGQNANLANTHGTDSLGYMPYYELESDWGWSDLYRFIHVLNEQPDSAEDVLDIDRTLWMHAFNYALLNFDSYIGYSQNYYLYKDDNGKFNTIPWDMNMSFGSFRETDGSMHFNGLTINQMKVANPLALLSFSVSPRPLVTKLIGKDTYKKMFFAHMRTILDENFRTEGWYLRGQHFQDVIDQAVTRDTNKFYTYEFFRQNLTTTVGASGSKDEFPGIKDLMDARVAYLDNYPGIRGAPVISGVAHDPQYPEQGQTVWVTAKTLNANSALLGYRFSHLKPFQKIAMSDDGDHHDSVAGDGIYGAELPVNGSVIQYFIYTENDTAGRFAPERAEYEYYTLQPLLKPGDISVNEIMIHGNIATNPEGSASPWIELSNNTADVISLKDVSLSDDPKQAVKWQFPDTIVGARGYLIAWADNLVSSEGIHCNFRLSGTSGKLVLANQSGVRIDSVDFPDKPENKSIGRYPNGTGPFAFMEPTYSASNYTGTTPLSGLLLYPNPVTDKIHVEMKNLNNPVGLQVFNAMGQVVIDKSYAYSADMAPVTNKEIDVSGLSQGAYYLRIICSDQTVTGTFIVY